MCALLVKVTAQATGHREGGELALMVLATESKSPGQRLSLSWDVRRAGSQSCFSNLVSQLRVIGQGRVGLRASFSPV